MDKKKLLETVRRVIKETISEKKYPVAGENGYIRVSQLKKGDVLGGSGLEVVNITSGATTPSGKVEVTVKDPKTGKQLTKVWGKSTTVRLKPKTDEAAAPAPSKPKPSTSPEIDPGIPEEEPDEFTLDPDTDNLPDMAPKAKIKKATMSEAEMLDKIVKRFRSAKKNG